MRGLQFVPALGALCLIHTALAQTGPVNGVRPSDLRVHALTNATVIPSPGQKIEKATIVIRDGVIEAIGTDLVVPAEARVWDATGKTIYPGLIDAAVLIRAADPTPGPGLHWNGRVRPQVQMSAQTGPTATQRKDLRALGFAAAAVYPSNGAFRGSGTVLALAEEDKHVLAYDDTAAMAVGFDYGGSWDRASYPGSLMGAIALTRQTFLDAQWRAQCQQVWRDHPQGHEPPIRADALDALAAAVAGEQTVLFDAADELDALRVAAIAREFNLKAALLGGGAEFRRLDEIVATGLPIVLPLNFPEPPKVTSLIDADRVSLREMMTWEQSPTNPRRLIDAGATVAITTHRMKKSTDFPAQLHEAIRHGLTEDAALAALTTTPAAMLGLDATLGSIAPGKAANLVVVDGSLFAKKPKVMETWINGRRHEVTAVPRITLKGKFDLRFDDDATILNSTIDTEKKSVSFKPPEGKSIKAADVGVQQERVSFVTEGSILKVDGFVQFSGVISEGALSGVAVMPDGLRRTFIATAAQEVARNDVPEQPVEGDGTKPQAAADEDADAKDADDEKSDDEKKGEKDDKDDSPFEMPPAELVFPLGEYGLPSPPKPQSVLVHSATLWTSGPEGVIENGWMLVRDGKISQIGRGGWPKIGVDVVIDAKGKHITPGLIDCHSHTGISGSVNEQTQNNTAEVRIGDVVDPDDIDWYRELAGGLTAANQLHGSANPIGGQNSVVKLKWGSPASAYPIPGAIGGIKFALGENVTRPDNRYPKTRMGVETMMRDAFSAARQYQNEHEQYASISREVLKARTMPPRPDMELEALAEILRGERIVHCHSYRQDEILMLIRLAEDFGFRIGTFQHVLEGFKVAEAIARHGAGGSSFSDWWGYKVEVMDAIPNNGAIMHDVGVLVSFNSDSNELARRMNTEAAKAVRYGGLSEAEALKFVTINPAKQLRVDNRIGSLEAGKDADFAVWSDRPLSTYARCEQTWVDGAMQFSLDQDRELRAQTEAERARLTQKVLAKNKPKKPGPSSGSDSTEKKDEPAPTRLMARMHQQWIAWMEEQVARGRDPEDLRPGDCGCNDGWAWTLRSQMEDSR